MEHRWGRRVKVNIPVQLMTANASVMGIGLLSNLSVSGALLMSDCSVRVLTQIQVKLESSLLPKHKTPTIAGYVARQYSHGIGVEWCERTSVLVADLLRATAAEPTGYIRQSETANYLAFSRNANGHRRVLAKTMPDPNVKEESCHKLSRLYVPFAI